MQVPLLQPTQRWWDDDSEPAGSDAAGIPAGSSDSDPVASLEAVATPDPVGRRQVPWRVALIVVGVCVGLAVAAVGGTAAWRAWRSARLDSLRETCVTTVDAQSAAWKGLEESLAEARSLLDAVEAADVADPSTVTDLSGLIDDVPSGPDARACEAVTENGLTAAAGRAESQARAYDSYAGRLDKAAAAVTGSRDEKVLADARSALDGAIDQGEALLASSEGMVGDEGTCDTLSAALDQAHTLDASDDPEALDRARARIGDAMDGVSASIRAKQDEEVRRKEEEAARQEQQSYAPAQSYAPSYGGGVASGGSTGGSSGGSSSGSTPSWSVPAPDSGSGFTDVDPSL